MNGLCGCGCGGETTIAKRNRKEKGHIKGLHTPFLEGHARKGKFEDLTTNEYGRLKVLKMVGQQVDRQTLWECECMCGVVTVVLRESLVSGATKSCGCLRRELMTVKKTTHGMSKTRTYNIWSGMWTRGTNINRKSSDRYVNRGITVEKRWGVFENFLADMGEAPPNMQIERKDNDKGYGPSNCKWATCTENVNNRSNTIRLSSDGNIKPLSQWAVELGINRATLYQRLHQEKISVEEAMTRPLRYKK
jgi:hypothetical protein